MKYYLNHANRRITIKQDEDLNITASYKGEILCKQTIDNYLNWIHSPETQEEFENNEPTIKDYIEHLLEIYRL